MPTVQLVADYTVPAGSTFIIDNELGFQAPLADGRTPAPNLDIAGDVILEGPTPAPGVTVSLVAGELLGSITVEAGAHVTMTSPNPITAVQVNYLGDVTNNGVIQITGGAAIGVHSGIETGHVINNGVLDVVGTFGSASAFSLWDTESFVNTGSISVQDTGPWQIVGVATGELRGDFSNSGSIVVSSNPQMPSVAVVVQLDGGAFDNTGLLQGDYALKANLSYYVQTPVIYDNDGVMRGAVDLGAGSDTLLNRGAIVGDVTLGDGSDTYDGRLGSTVGLVSGGAGNDSLIGGQDFDYLQGNTGDDVIDGGSAGNDWLVGGQGNDLIIAHSGQNILYGNLGDDTLDAGSGGDIVRGGQGDDLIVGGAGNDWISGDRGSDTVTGGAGADTFHTFSGAGTDVVTDFNVAEGDRVQLDAGTTYTVSQSGSDVLIDMGNGDEMILKNVTLSTLPSGWLFSV